MNLYPAVLASLLVLGCVLNFMPGVISVNAGGPIFIRADGTVDPVTANISRNGDLYTLTDNIVSDDNGIVIERNNTVLDGAGFTVQGAGVNRSRGISFPQTTNITVRNMKIREFGIGVYLNESSGSSISRNEITRNWIGILISSCSDNIISGNNVTANTKYGVLATLYADHNTFFRNNISSSYSGFRFDYTCSSNTVFENNLANNQHGILFLFSSSGNKVFHNNIIDSSLYQVFSETSINTWDDDYPSCGNYWSDYAGVDLHSGFDQTENGPDGIGDTAYYIPRRNKDRFPLMGMFRSFDATSHYQVTVVSNSTIEEFTYNGSSKAIKMCVSNTQPNQVYGFCRVSIPHALINGTYYAYADDEEPYYVNYNAADNGTHRWLYFIYPYWTREITIQQVQRDITPPTISNVHQQPTNDNVYPTDKVVVYAEVTDDLSGVRQVMLNFTNGNGTWTAVDMANLAGNTYNATIPESTYGTNVTYMIKAEDNANNTITTEELGYQYKYMVIPESSIWIVLPLLALVTLWIAATCRKTRRE